MPVRRMCRRLTRPSRWAPRAGGLPRWRALLAIAREAWRGCRAPRLRLPERARRFRQACQAAGLRFIGPRPRGSALFGDKAQARARWRRAAACLLMPGTQHGHARRGPRPSGARSGDGWGVGIIIKAIGGGGGRSMRAVQSDAELPAAYDTYRRGQAAFGVAGVLRRAPDGERAPHPRCRCWATAWTWSRWASADARAAALPEARGMAPSPSLPRPDASIIQDALAAGARRCATRAWAPSSSWWTWRPATCPMSSSRYSPRLQVQAHHHREVTGVDLVCRRRLHWRLNRHLQEPGPGPGAAAAHQGHAIQWRINAETLDAQGRAQPGSGTIARLAPPGPGVRVDTYALVGRAPSPHYDTLLCRLIDLHARRQFC